MVYISPNQCGFALACVCEVHFWQTVFIVYHSLGSSFAHFFGVVSDPLYIYFFCAFWFSWSGRKRGRGGGEWRHWWPEISRVSFLRWGRGASLDSSVCFITFHLFESATWTLPPYSPFAVRLRGRLPSHAALWRWSVWWPAQGNIFQKTGRELGAGVFPSQTWSAFEQTGFTQCSQTKCHSPFFWRKNRPMVRTSHVRVFVFWCSFFCCNPSKAKHSTCSPGKVYISPRFATYPPGIFWHEISYQYFRVLYI